MGNKTIYVKPRDIPLWESLRLNKRSIGSMFADFLRSSADIAGSEEKISQDQFLAVNPAREDQRTIYFLCTLCGCLVRSDYVEKHQDKCRPRAA